LNRESLPAADSGFAGGARATGLFAKDARKFSLPPIVVVLSKDWSGSLGAALTAIFVLTAFLAPWLSPHDPLAQHLFQTLKPPCWLPGGSPDYVLGTDQLGRDILSRLIYGARISMLVGVLSVAIGVGVGVFLGLLAGYEKGAADTVIGWLVDVQLSVPLILIILALMAVTGPGLDKVIIVLGLTGWMLYARVVRGETLRVGNMLFVEAAQADGCGELRILLRHILPNTLSPVVVIAALEVGRRIITEATLSFLGAGVPPPEPSWGRMISEGRDVLVVAWWVSTFPGIAITLTVVGVSLLGDFLRDYFDPRLRNRPG
jgi:peptide/nickel transport system permease protein